MLLDSGGQRLTKAVCGRIAHGIDQTKLRRKGIACPSGQDEVVVAAIAAVLQHFQCGCRAAKNDRDVALLGNRDSKISGRVAQAFLLFEGVIVFLIDDNQPQFCWLALNLLLTKKNYPRWRV